MMPLRPELLELTPQALTALSNAGFVKRAQKELDNGNIPALEQDEAGTLTAVFRDGTRTRLEKDRALKESSCTCGASGMCRHRVMLILSYQRANAGHAAPEAEPNADERWHPGLWQEELATLPESILKRAQQLADKGLTVELFCRPNETPSAKLPMSDVRFYSRSSIRFARCDCIEGSLCEHIALAVQAFTDARSPTAGLYASGLANPQPQGRRPRRTFCYARGRSLSTKPPSAKPTAVAKRRQPAANQLRSRVHPRAARSACGQLALGHRRACRAARRRRCLPAARQPLRA
ncbi:SWIM zinc finger [Klebsiella grimontii]|uniref:SWIM zinc finger n=1 Tax=Klebsiella grimontii TaxID=2058152 RepID=A0A7H4P056_9ENTR|nr:SWIM zinc finger [Klebsiella grimontii]